MVSVLQLVVYSVLLAALVTTTVNAAWEFTVSSSGLLLARANSVTPWQTVCDDYFGPDEAAVIARELGCLPEQGCVYEYGTAYSDDLGRGYSIGIDDIVCPSPNVTFDQCTYSRFHNCAHWEDVVFRTHVTTGVEMEFMIAPATHLLLTRPANTSASADWSTVCSFGVTSSTMRVLAQLKFGASAFTPVFWATVNDTSINPYTPLMSFLGCTTSVNSNSTFATACRFSDLRSTAAQSTTARRGCETHEVIGLWVGSSEVDFELSYLRSDGYFDIRARVPRDAGAIITFDSGALEYPQLTSRTAQEVTGRAICSVSGSVFNSTACRVSSVNSYFLYYGASCALPNGGFNLRNCNMSLARSAYERWGLLTALKFDATPTTSWVTINERGDQLIRVHAAATNRGNRTSTSIMCLDWRFYYYYYDLQFEWNMCRLAAGGRTTGLSLNKMLMWQGAYLRPPNFNSSSVASYVEPSTSAGVDGYFKTARVSSETAEFMSGADWKWYRDEAASSCFGNFLHLTCNGSGLEIATRPYLAPGSRPTPWFELLVRPFSNTIFYNVQSPLVGNETAAALCRLNGYTNATPATVNVSSFRMFKRSDNSYFDLRTREAFVDVKCGINARRFSDDCSFTIRNFRTAGVSSTYVDMVLLQCNVLRESFRFRLLSPVSSSSSSASATRPTRGIVLAKPPGMESPEGPICDIDIGSARFICAQLGFKNPVRVKYGTVTGEQASAVLRQHPPSISLLRCPPSPTVASIDKCDTVTETDENARCSYSGIIELDCDADGQVLQLRIDKNTNTVLGSFDSRRWMPLTTFSYLREVRNALARVLCKSMILRSTDLTGVEKTAALRLLSQSFGWWRGATTSLVNQSDVVQGPMIALTCPTVSTVDNAPNLTDCTATVETGTLSRNILGLSCPIFVTDKATNLTVRSSALGGVIPWRVASGSLMLQPIGAEYLERWGANINSNAAQRICVAAGYPEDNSDVRVVESCLTDIQGGSYVGYFQNLNCPTPRIPERQQQQQQAAATAINEQQVFESLFADCSYEILPLGSSRCYSEIVCGPVSRREPIQVEIRDHNIVWMRPPGVPSQWGVVSPWSVQGYALEPIAKQLCQLLGREPGAVSVLRQEDSMPLAACSVQCSSWARSIDDCNIMFGMCSYSFPNQIMVMTCGANITAPPRTPAPPSWIYTPVPRPLPSTPSPALDNSNNNKQGKNSNSSGKNSTGAAASNNGASSPLFESIGVPVVLAVACLLIMIVVVIIARRNNNDTDEEHGGDGRRQAAVAMTQSIRDDTRQAVAAVTANSVAGGAESTTADIERFLLAGAAEEGRRAKSAAHRGKRKQSAAAAGATEEEERAALALIAAVSSVRKPLRSGNSQSGLNDDDDEDGDNNNKNVNETPEETAAALRAVAAAMNEVANRKLQQQHAPTNDAAAVSPQHQHEEERTTRVQMPLADLAVPSRNVAAGSSSVSKPNTGSEEEKGLSLDDL